MRTVICLGFLVGLVVAGAAMAQHAITPGPTKQLTVVSLELQKPVAWRARRYGNYCMRVGPGVLISSIAGRNIPHMKIKNGCGSGWNISVLPTTYVAVDVSLFDFPFPLRPPQFPLKLESFDHNKPVFCHCTQWWSEFSLAEGDHAGYTVRVWIGNRASPAARIAMKRLIRSIVPMK